MAVKLRLDNGKTKVYRTWYTKTEGENGPTKYISKCGMCRESRPSINEECRHLDCAIRAVENSDGLALFGVFSIIFGWMSFGHLLEKGLHEYGLFWSTMIILFGILCVLGGLYSFAESYEMHKKHQELVEFKERGTVNGIGARKI